MCMGCSEDAWGRHAPILVIVSRGPLIQKLSNLCTCGELHGHDLFKNQYAELITQEEVERMVGNG